MTSKVTWTGISWPTSDRWALALPFAGYFSSPGPTAVVTGRGRTSFL